MTRWFWKRWIWAVLVGTTAAVGLTMAQQGGTDAPTGPPKVGDVITLKFKDLPDRQVKVLKSDKQPDGSILSEVKDTKSGETFTLMDKPGDFAAKPAASKTAPKAIELPGEGESPKASVPAKPQTAPPKAKPRTSDPLLPPLKDALPNLPSEKEQEKEKEKDRERRFFPSVGKSSATTPEPEEDKPGLLKRVFGRKKATPPATPALPSTSTSAKPATPGVAMPPTSRSSPVVTLEPPRTQGLKPVEPPTPITPAPISLPTRPTTASIPTPLPPATVTVPPPLSLPPIPTAPGGSIPVPSNLPSIPVPPSGMSVNEPIAPPPMTAAVAMATPMAPTVLAPVKPIAAVPMMEPKAVAVKETVAMPVKEPAVVAAKEPTMAPMPSAVVTASQVVAAPATVQPVAAQPLAVVPVTPPLTPVMAAMMRDIEPHLKALQDGIAPSQRAMAARALCGGRHGSSDTVKMMVFRAAQHDPNPMVRAVCIEELCKLGYFEPAFEVYLTKASSDASEEVRKAAKDALYQMTPRR